MKKAKKLYTLLGVLAVFCILTIAVSMYEEKKEEIKTSGEIIFQIERDDVKKISWEYDSTSLSFSRDEVWVYDEDEAFPVHDDKVTKMLAPFDELRAAFIIENVDDLSTYGLKNPECTITLETESETYEILLGDFSTMDSQRYVSIGDGNVYLVTEDPMDTYEKTLDDFFLHDDVPSFTKVQKVTFAGTENSVITYEEDSVHTYNAEDTYFTEVNGETVPVDTEKIKDYVNAFSSLSLLDYKSYQASSELETYGLHEPDLTVTISYLEEDEEKTFDIAISKDPEAKEDEEDYVGFVRIGESEIIYEITQSSYDSIMAVSYNDLRHEKLYTASFSDITAIEIVLEGETYEISSQKISGDMTYYYNDEEIEKDDLSSALAGLTAAEFTAEEPSQKLEISLTLSLENENFPQVQLELYRYDGEQCLAVVDGEPIALVDREDVVDLIEAVNAIVLK